MEDDWDLHAVVRSCTSSTTTTTAAAAAAAEQTPRTQLFSTTSDQDCSSLQDLLFEPRRENNSSEELHDLCKPFFPKKTINSEKALFIPPQRLLPVSPLSVLGGLQDLSFEQAVVKQPPPKTQIHHKNQLFSVVNGSKPTSSHHPNPRSKKRKNPLKKVCHVSAEGLSSDMWSWRKYGQKPIKGSPYPRGYYKCSTLTGCMARKQVERNKSDPGMFVITYTAEHNHPVPTHRNSLAGSSRNKPAEAPNSDEPKKAASSSSEMLEDSSQPEEDFAAGVDLDDEDDDLSPSNMALDDSFFAGLDDLDGEEGGECFSTTDRLSTSLQFPWLASSGTAASGAAAAAGGGC
ncbi:hypothetical protein MIMGU_mgv1a009324mg [Erythranthe guttata]|uniref:WRKY domain-containing protein n=1 Tax=Erythranthe guttata TaxID=4155 RepID=A0A022R396_ERYGU|nr:PREDICTED: WRKY transcription factor 22-like [Erythranthe guttata]EYU35112.1 hypothetical protein MIMGU_mgv1a009324mg [Erythranthe guttata]|eukprot:XP_012840165.1 PREDICTED: WRKY transcription factor 22-like [Erythranthe guttata]